MFVDVKKKISIDYNIIMNVYHNLFNIKDKLKRIGKIVIVEDVKLISRCIKNVEDQNKSYSVTVLQSYKQAEKVLEFLPNIYNLLNFALFYLSIVKRTCKRNEELKCILWTK